MKNKEKKLFPLFVDLTGKKAVVVGAGKIATRRVKTLLPFLGEIQVIAPKASGEILELAEQGEVIYQKKCYEYDQLLLYFVYRHFMNARDDDAVREKVQFALISTAVIQALDIFHWMTHGTLSHWDQICICKAYSRAIEYDEENTECLSNFIFDT